MMKIVEKQYTQNKNSTVQKKQFDYIVAHMLAFSYFKPSELISNDLYAKLNIYDTRTEQPINRDLLAKLSYEQIMSSIINLPVPLLEEFKKKLLSAYSFSTNCSSSETKNYLNLGYLGLYSDIEKCQEKVLDDKLEANKTYREYYKAVMSPEKYLENMNLITSHYSKHSFSNLDKYKKREFFNTIIASRFFKDSANNTLINLDIVFDFAKRYYKDLSPKEKKQVEKMAVIRSFFYRQYAKSNVSSALTQKEFEYYKDLYQTLKNAKTPMHEILYDILKRAREINIKDYLSTLTPLTSFPYTSVNGVKVYENKKLPFNFFISNSPYLRNTIEPIEIRGLQDIISMTYVSSDCLVTFKNLNKSLTFIYTDFPPEQFITACSFDNYSSFRINPRDCTAISRFPMTIRKPKEMLEENYVTKEYSEFNVLSITDDMKHIFHYEDIDMLDSVKAVMPKALFCLNGPTAEELDIAKLLGLDIFSATINNYRSYGMIERKTKKDGVPIYDVENDYERV